MDTRGPAKRNERIHRPAKAPGSTAGAKMRGENGRGHSRGAIVKSTRPEASSRSMAGEHKGGRLVVRVPKQPGVTNKAFRGH